MDHPNETVGEVWEIAGKILQQEKPLDWLRLFNGLLAQGFSPEQHARRNQYGEQLDRLIRRMNGDLF